MIVIEDVQLTPKRVPVGGNYLLRVRARDNADVSYADTEMLEMAISMVAQYTPSDYKDFSGAAAAVAAAQFDVIFGHISSGWGSAVCRHR